MAKRLVALLMLLLLPAACAGAASAPTVIDPDAPVVTVYSSPT